MSVYEWSRRAEKKRGEGRVSAWLELELEWSKKQTLKMVLALEVLGDSPLTES